MKTPRPHFLPLACALLALAVPVRAEALGWKRTTVEVAATARQEKAEAVFAFRNEGARRVTVTTAARQSNKEGPSASAKRTRANCWRTTSSVRKIHLGIIHLAVTTRRP